MLVCFLLVDLQVHQDTSVSFSRYCSYKMLTSIALVSILGPRKITLDRPFYVAVVFCTGAPLFVGHVALP